MIVEAEFDDAVRGSCDTPLPTAAEVDLERDGGMAAVIEMILDVSF